MLTMFTAFALFQHENIMKKQAAPFCLVGCDLSLTHHVQLFNNPQPQTPPD